jgi:hypothetical protein
MYAKYMGLLIDEHKNIFIPEEKNLKILDIGGGPTSLLLKTYNLKEGKIIDPLKYPD